jgi:hypothetical protein
LKKLVWGIIIWLLCLYLVLLKPDQRADASLKGVWWAANSAIWMVVVMFPLLVVISLFVK